MIVRAACLDQMAAGFFVAASILFRGECGKPRREDAAPGRLHPDGGDDSGQDHESGERVETVLKAAGRVPDPADKERPHEPSDIADGVDESHAGRGSGAGQESRRQWPEGPLRSVKSDGRKTHFSWGLHR